MNPFPNPPADAGPPPSDDALRAAVQSAPAALRPWAALAAAKAYGKGLPLHPAPAAAGHAEGDEAPEPFDRE
ncbi:MAG: hypothetical protein KGI56_11145, partial [Acidobacteriota bacterium]|nr:hypothetical protein [Acidobacteriota bacterium]